MRNELIFESFAFNDAGAIIVTMSVERFPAQPNQSLIDGLSVLQTVAASADPVGSREVARRLGLEPTRVNRLLKTLAGLSLCEQGEDRKYRSGPGLHVIAATALFGSRLIARATGPIESLRKELPDLTVALGVRWRNEVAYLIHLLPGRPVAEGIGKAALFPAEKSSIGRVLLAGLTQAEIKSLFPKLHKLVVKTLQEPRKKQHAFVRGLDQCSLAVPIGPLFKAHTALAVAGDFSLKDVPRLTKLLHQASAEIHQHK